MTLRTVNYFRTILYLVVLIFERYLNGLYVKGIEIDCTHFYCFQFGAKHYIELLY
jgi:hypothetical protein